MSSVENERLPATQLVLQELGQAGVPALGHSRGEADSGLFFRIVVNVEMLGREHLEIEALVLDLVPPEILRARRHGRAKYEDDGHHRCNKTTHTSLVHNCCNLWA